MSIRIHLPTAVLVATDQRSQRVVGELTGKSVVFLTNHRGRNAEIFAALRDVLVSQFGAARVDERPVGHGKTAPPETLAPLGQEYAAAISAIGA